MQPSLPTFGALLHASTSPESSDYDQGSRHLTIRCSQCRPQHAFDQTMHADDRCVTGPIACCSSSCPASAVGVPRPSPSFRPPSARVPNPTFQRQQQRAARRSVSPSRAHAVLFAQAAAEHGGFAHHRQRQRQQQHMACALRVRQHASSPQLARRRRPRQRSAACLACRADIPWQPLQPRY